MHYLVPMISAAVFTAVAVFLTRFFAEARKWALLIGFLVGAICGIGAAYFYVYQHASDGPCEEIGCGFQLAAFVVISFQFLVGVAFSAFTCSWVLAGRD